MTNSKYGTYTTENYELSKKNDLDAGLDIYSNETTIIQPHTHSLIATGIKLSVPNGHVGLLWSRSGLSSQFGIEVGAGCIDSTYRGEIKVLLYNHSDVPFVIQKGNRIAQLLTIPVMVDTYLKVEELDETGRGHNGFGSTGL